MTDSDIANAATLAEQALPVGTGLSGDQFTITGRLAAGGFGITYRATDNMLGRTIVIKECFPEDLCVRHDGAVVARSKAYAETYRSVVDMFMREARSLAKLRHPNIVGVHRAFEENGTAYMALDLIDGRDLFDILDKRPKALSPRRVKGILMQMLDAIEKVHEMDLLHRDISPDNIIIERTGTPVLIDFGAARGDASRRTRAVSSLLVVKEGYSPQEFYVAGSEQSPCSDLYALGATFYHVLSGRAPPDSQTRMIEMAGKKPDPCVPLVGRIKGYDEAFLRAIDLAMELHPSDRLQSAAKWKSMIAESITGTGPTSESGPGVTNQNISLDLEMSLSRLVEETNDEVRKSQLIPNEPEEVVAAPQTSSKPIWVDEFNEESMTPPRAIAADRLDDFEQEDAVFGGSDDVGRRPTPSETNWIGRAKEKQERIRSERTKHLTIFPDEPTQRVRSTVSKNLPVDPVPMAEETVSPPARSTGVVRSLGTILVLLVCVSVLMLFESP